MREVILSKVNWQCPPHLIWIRYTKERNDIRINGWKKAQSHLWAFNQVNCLLLKNTTTGRSRNIVPRNLWHMLLFQPAHFEQRLSYGIKDLWQHLKGRGFGSREREETEGDKILREGRRKRKRWRPGHVDYIRASRSQLRNRQMVVASLPLLPLLLLLVVLLLLVSMTI